MLIECKHCGAPLDVKPAKRTAKCNYCGSTSVIGEVRTVASSTPAEWKPPREWTPPAHVAADSSKPLRFRAEYWIHQIAGLLITLAVAGVMATVAGIALISELRSKPKTEARPSSGGTAEIETERSSGLFDEKGLEKLSSRYEKKLGTPVRAVELTIHREHASLTAQSPDDPEHVNRYRYRGGRVDKGQPVPNARYRGKLSAHLFDLGSVPFARIPGFVEKAVSKLDYEKGKASHLIIRRKRGSSSDVTIRVFVSSKRESGSVEFDAEGKVVRTLE